MMAGKLPYSEGDIFALPLRDGGYGLGVVARMNGKGAVFGYFFGRRYDEPPALAEVGELDPIDNVWVPIFGDLGLTRGTWPVVGPLPGWQRAEWPMPAFGRHEELTGRYLRVEYGDDDPNSRPKRNRGLARGVRAAARGRPGRVRVRRVPDEQAARRSDVLSPIAGVQFASAPPARPWAALGCTATGDRRAADAVPV
jgi:hypothetical protein